jgi:hypothetical protein
MIFGAYEAIDREAIWAALFDWFKSQLTAPAANPGFVTIGRRHVPPPDLTIPDQPALFQISGREVHIPQKPPGAPSKLLLKGFLVVYAFIDAPQEDIGAETVLGETILNGLLYKIDQALLPDNPTTGKFTIGGLVEHCWIEGDTDLDPGIFGPQAAALLPLNILVP